ncbi:MAG TPA: ABC transporter ATP-binding protein [Rubrivivax sp.]|jgi:branched-chain amino acid transport system ATP-binding protein|nr:ABC transporter ATP-binding protein [Rubrivivax sp.]
MTLLQVSGLCKSFGGVRANQDVRLAVKAGQVHSIIGPNGAGKTSLINLLSGLYRPDAGSIRIEDRELAGLAAHRFAAAGIARTFQNLQVFFNMTALENVMTGHHLREPVSLLSAMLGLPSLVRAERRCVELAQGLLERVGLSAWLHAEASAMPYGALKRLEIARALAAEPRVLLLDEPAAGLNASEARDVDAMVRRMAGDGLAVVLVEHNMKLVMEVSDRITVLDRGAVLAEGAPDEVARDPRVIDAYLGAAGEADARGA